MLSGLQEWGVDSERACLFLSGLDTGLIKPLHEASLFRAHLGLMACIPVLLYSGNMVAKQVLELLLEAARRLSARKDVVLCGHGSQRAALACLNRDMSTVRFPALPSVEQLNELLNLGDIHLLPRRADAADCVMPSKLRGILAGGGAIIAAKAERLERRRRARGPVAGLLID